MAERKFSKGEAVRFGWETVTSNLGLFVVAVAIMLGVNLMPVVSGSIVVAIVASLLCLVVAMGLMRMSLRFVDGGRGELADLFATFSLIVKYILASVIVGIVVLVGVILLIIPGIIWGVRLQFYGWAVVDKGAAPFEAVRMSWEMTRGSFWNLFLLGLVLALVNILGALALLVGLLVTVPLSVVAMGYVYRKLERAATV